MSHPEMCSHTPCRYIYYLPLLVPLFSKPQNHYFALDFWLTFCLCIKMKTTHNCCFFLSEIACLSSPSTPTPPALSWPQVLKLIHLHYGHVLHLHCIPVVTFSQRAMWPVGISPFNILNHYLKTAVCIYSGYLKLKFVWLSETCNCDKYAELKIK